MKRTPRTGLIAALILFAVFPSWMSAAAEPKAPPAKNAGAPTKQAAAGLTFRVQQLHVDNNEGCAIADFNRDGKLDVSAGEHWYPGPTFTEKKPLRKLLPFGKDYDGNGWKDIAVAGKSGTHILWNDGK